MMIKTWIFSLSFLLIYATAAFAHAEFVATLQFETYDGHLHVKAYLDKSHLVHALKEEANCQPADMMKVCGNRYVTDNLSIKIDGIEVVLDKQSMDIGKDYVTISYKSTDAFESFDELEVYSSYMFKYNSHAHIKLKMQLEDNFKTYTLKHTRRTATIRF